VLVNGRADDRTYEVRKERHLLYDLADCGGKKTGPGITPRP